jgi:hypothetical protein
LGSISEELNELDLSEQDFESTLIPYLKNSIQWIQDYVKSDNPLPLHKDDGCFQQVVDIEENYWSPTIGIKGKIDVSFKVTA